MSYKVCIIGHITRDYVRIGDRSWTAPGGTAYYLSIALHSLGVEPIVITKLKKEDRCLLSDLEERGIEVIAEYTKHTTTFENVYVDGKRLQRVISTSSPFTAKDIDGINADLFYLGSLTRNDLEEDLLSRLRNHFTAIDAQGMLRKVDGGRINLERMENPDKLSCVDIIKLNERESIALAGKTDLTGAIRAIKVFGPGEIVITLGENGSVIHANGKTYRIPPFKTKVVDPTGCGDTYMAGYIYKRLRTKDYNEIGIFSSAVASIKLSKRGPFTGSERDVESFINSSGKGRKAW